MSELDEIIQIIEEDQDKRKHSPPANDRRRSSVDRPSRKTLIGAYSILGLFMIGIFSVAIYIHLGQNRTGNETDTNTEAPLTTTSVPTTTPPVTPPPPANLAPNFQLVNVKDSEVFQLAQFRGKPVLLEFFTINCPHCHDYLPTLQTVSQAYGNQLVMISISAIWAADSVPALQQFVTNSNIGWRVALDTPSAALVNGQSSSATAAYNVTATPTTVLINREGRSGYHQTGVIAEETLRSKIDSLLLSFRMNRLLANSKSTSHVVIWNREQYWELVSSGRKRARGV